MPRLIPVWSAALLIAATAAQATEVSPEGLIRARQLNAERQRQGLPSVWMFRGPSDRVPKRDSVPEKVRAERPSPPPHP